MAERSLDKRAWPIVPPAKRVNATRSVLTYIEANMTRVAPSWSTPPPETLAELARDLGYSAKALRGLQETHGDQLVAHLQARWRAVVPHKPNHLRVSATVRVPADELSTIATPGESGHTEREPERVDSERLGRIHREKSAADSIKGARHRVQAEKLRIEAQLNRARKKGKRGKVVALEAQLARTIRRAGEAA